MMASELKVFKIDDCDYVAGVSEQQVLDWYRKNITDPIDEHHEVNPAVMKINEAEEGEEPIEVPMITHMQSRLDAGVTVPFLLGCDPSYA